MGDTLHPIDGRDYVGLARKDLVHQDAVDLGVRIGAAVSQNRQYRF
jgi:hypothetical protein